MAEKKKQKLPIIKTREQLKMVIDGLSDQGFGYYVGDWKAHQYKVDNLMNQNNTLNIDEKNYKYELNELVQSMTDYDEIDKTMKKFFSKFTPDDKIKELANKFYLKPEMEVHVPSDWSPDKKDIIAWVKFKRKYKISGEPKFNWNVSVYNLDKNHVKIKSSDKYDFDRLYKLIFGEEPKEWSSQNKGDWQDLGKIQVKLFQNGNMDVKGDLKLLKSYLYEQIYKYDCIIFYNKKKEIFEKRKRD